MGNNENLNYENNPPSDDVNPILLDENNWLVSKNNQLEGIRVPAATLIQMMRI
ncbi:MULTISPECIES: hypothetical protein [Bacillus]|uniref:hypothetical protein n=1 Tax=Bacillus TaxID=1386 RepID=UPI001587D619|nr:MULTISPECIES: hypothetical protein [Bacillus]MCU4720377.1 hypothetical protein [Bacillus cereus]MED3055591.1 hypothetical protein [Bacillus thuringiensis]MED3313638.1 hypothetical protein [Bacillus thuringiensis]